MIEEMHAKFDHKEEFASLQSQGGSFFFFFFFSGFKIDLIKVDFLQPSFQREVLLEAVDQEHSAHFLSLNWPINYPLV